MSGDGIWVVTIGMNHQAVAFAPKAKMLLWLIFWSLHLRHTSRRGAGASPDRLRQQSGKRCSRVRQHSGTAPALVFYGGPYDKREKYPLAINRRELLASASHRCPRCCGRRLLIAACVVRLVSHSALNFEPFVLMCFSDRPNFQSGTRRHSVVEG
jgi:hypothetical protein